jgi:mevalonate kinase
MKTIIVSAPSKLHLSGEHAVVYGKPAVLVATNKRLFVTISEIATSRLASGLAMTKKSVIAIPREIEGEAISSNISIVRKSDKYIDYICQVFEKKYSLFINHYSLFINSDIPQGRGMGSSAALAVALIAALSKFYKKPWDLAQINELAYQAEKFVHQNSSGGDVSIVTHGGILWYRREFEFLKTFWSLPIKFPQNFNKFVLIDTGRTESTGTMVAFVGRKLQIANNKLQIIFDNIEKTTKQIILAIKLGDEKLFMDCFKNNELFLEKIGVVSNQTQKLIREIEKSGGVAKISGAGGVKTGSGIVISYHHDPKILIQIAKKYQFPFFQVKLGEEGVKIEKIVV